MSGVPIKTAYALTPEQRARKKRYLHATVVTCLALAMVFGIVHVVQLGANRMADMRARATYDLKEEALRHYRHPSFREAQQIIDDYMTFYNYERIQLKTKLTPYEWRCQSV